MNWIRAFQNFDRSPVGQVLISLAETHQPVWVEVERSHHRFQTAIGYRKGVALIPKPKQPQLGLKPDHYLRFATLEDATRAVRLRVVTPTFNLPDGNSVVLCKVDRGFVEGPQRQEPRFDTRRIPNLLLGLPGKKKTFRILDLSEHGVCVVAPMQNNEPIFPIGEDLGPAQLYVGKFNVPLAGVLPRSQRKNGLGLQLVAHNDIRAVARMQKLLTVLERALTARPLPDPVTA